MRHRFRIFFLVLILFLICGLCASCAEKKTGEGIDSGDDDTGADDDEAPATGVGSYSISLNMVSVPIGESAAIENREFYAADGAKLEAQSILVSEVINSLEAFTADAHSFEYELINHLEVAAAEWLAYDELVQAVFYEDPDQKILCLGWLEAGHEAQSLCDIEDGYLVTHPVNDAFDIQPISYVNERTGDQPTHLGEEVALQAIVTIGTGVMVSGSYLKTFIQADGYGVKVFGDMSATMENQGYDGSLLSEIYTFEGDEIFIKGHVTLHDGMIEFVPISGYHLAVLYKNNPVEAPVTKTVDELTADPYRWAGTLVRIDGVEMVDVNPDDPTTDWPEYGTKSKDIRIQQNGAGPKIGLPIYEGTGIPGSRKPAAAFNVVGAFNIEALESYSVYMRKIEDVNPGEEHLGGTVSVSIVGENKSGPVNLATLPVGYQVLEEGGEPVPIVSLAAIIQASGISRNPKKLEYKPVAYDDRKPFDTLIFDEMKSGVLFQDTPSEEGQPDPMLSSYFWAGLNLSDIYFLKGVTDIQAFREQKPPEEGDAEHGEGVTLMINNKKYAINFDTLNWTKYEGQDAIALTEFLSDQIISLFTMDGSFTTDQIKKLYDYRLVAFDEQSETLVRYPDYIQGYLVMDNPPYTVFPQLGDETRVDDLYVIDLKRYIQVDTGDGEPIVIYLNDCETQSVDIGGGVMEDVVFYSTILEQAGIDTSQNMYLYDYWLIASDDFISTWTYGHNHLENMYFRPLENRGYTDDPDLSAYGGRVSTKAVYEIEFHPVPQEAPAIPVVIDGETLWGSDANTCDGCHFKDGNLNLPIDCYSCHTSPK